MNFETLRIIYPSDLVVPNGVAVIIPCPGWFYEHPANTLEALIAKDVPEGVPYKIVDASELPSDLTFRDAWEYQI